MITIKYITKVLQNTRKENKPSNEIIDKNLNNNKFENNQSDEIELYKNQKYVWYRVLLFGTLHIAGIFGTYLVLTSAKIWTTLFVAFLCYVAGMGVTAGAHRLWTHASYKATWQLKVILMLCNTLAFQYNIIYWAREHRLHHKYTDKNADPHNSKRGFFYSHIGWLLLERLPETVVEGKNIYLKDLFEDPILQFQRKYYCILMPSISFMVPTIIPWYFWNESLVNAFIVAGLWRYALTLHGAFLVNSAAHMWGTQPYDKKFSSRENRFVAMITFGEGWHNYHHVFPWDYKTGELGGGRLNLTTSFIDFFAKIGWAYDLKTVSDDTLSQRVMKTGDGTHPIWGWGDKDQTVENIKFAS